MGHSLGGLALALYLEGHEKPLPEEAVRLVLIAPAVETTRAVDAFFLLMQLPPEVRTELDEYILELSGHPFSWFSLRRALFQVRADILYLQDEEDRVTPMEDALAVKKDNHPRIRFVFTRGLGHRKIYKDPEMQQQIVAFL
jgi:pimeloyl-ACP methyl ester carboxylesterase